MFNINPLLLGIYLAAYGIIKALLPKKNINNRRITKPPLNDQTKMANKPERESVLNNAVSISDTMEAPSQAEDDSLYQTTARGPIDVRSVSLAVLALLATLFALQWASVVLIPLMLAIFISFALNPIVKRLAKWKIPRPIGAPLLLVILVGGFGYLSSTLQDEAVTIIDQLPQAVKQLRYIIAINRNYQGGVIDKMQEAAKEIEKVTEDSSGAPSPIKKSDVTVQSDVTRVQLEQPVFQISDYLWGGTVGAVAVVTQFFIVFMLVLFFLIWGDLYKRKLVKITGPTLTKKRITVQIIDEFTKQIQRYLFVLVLSGSFVGVFTWLAFSWIGFNQAAMWGVVAGLLSTIPYLGPAIVFAATGIIALLQFGTITMALFVAGVSLFITSVQGYWLTPWLTSKTAKINAIAVFIGILFWGWMWGFGGVFLATPILMVIKSCCDHIENLKPLGELLGD